MACASGYAKDGYCRPGPISREKVKPKPCAADTDCELVDKAGNIIDYSQC